MVSKSNLTRYDNKKITIIFICLFFILTISNIIESYSFLSKLDINTPYVGFREIIIYVLCGSMNGRTNLLDLFRFSMPYVLILFITGIYITDIWDNSGNFFYIIRYKNYKKWIRYNFIKLIFIVVRNFSIYYLLLIMISMIFFHKNTNFTKIFFILYPYYDYSSDFIQLIITQWVLSISIEVILVLVQFLLGMFFKDIFGNFCVLSFIIFVFSFTGKYDCYNPLMLSKHTMMDVNLSVNPIITITSCITITLIINLFMSNIIKVALRRNIL